MAENLLQELQTAANATSQAGVSDLQTTAEHFEFSRGIPCFSLTQELLSIDHELIFLFKAILFLIVERCLFVDDRPYITLNS